MLKKRVIPVLFLMDGKIVRSETFNKFKIIGDPYHELSRFSEWNADELVYLDISRAPDNANTLKILDKIGDHAFMPLAFGGNIRTFEYAASLIKTGAEKVVINTLAYENPGIITKLAHKFGSQAVTVSIDCVQNKIWTHGGSIQRAETACEWARIVEGFGAGEILLQSIDRDGTGKGYDLNVVTDVAKAVGIPVVACGGAGRFEHFVEGFNAGAHAVAAGNIFHFTENAYPRAKKYLVKAGIPVRYEEE